MGLCNYVETDGNTISILGNSNKIMWDIEIFKDVCTFLLPNASLEYVYMKEDMELIGSYFIINYINHKLCKTKI